jgi:antitoxin component of MazEF toxin-antitoxin module
MRVERNIRRIGNSLGVIIPADALKILQIEEQDVVRIWVEDDKIMMEKKENP